MSLSDLKLGLMAFPQRWDGTQLRLRVLLLPSGDPLNQPLTPSGPPFAGTQLHLQAVIIPDLDNLPSPSSAGAQSFHFNSIVPPDAITLFNQLASTYNVVAPPSNPPPINAQIKKALPQSYIDAFPFEQPRHPFAVVGDEFACSIRSKNPGITNPPPSNSVTWGQLLSFALRQPQLAVALGLLYEVQIPIDPALVKNGGWIYVTLDESNPANPYITDWQANRDLIKHYAARLPALTTSRQVLAAVLFPVVDVLPNPGFYDEALIEVEEYDDGFTKIVHCSQPTSLDAATGDQNQLTPGTDAGLQIGWDDEQVVIWHNRQLDTARDRRSPNPPTAAEAPLGVTGYRVDVRREGESQWHSLCQATGKINFGPLQLMFNGEPAIEPTPVRSQEASDTEAWLPRYFAQWRGKSLVVNDETPYKLTGGGKPLPATFLSPLLPPGVFLLYGKKYEFRARLADLTGGGPIVQDEPINPAPANVTQCLFQRFVPPKSVRISTTPSAPDSSAPFPANRPIDSISVWRPLLGYPEFTFSGVTDPTVVQKLIALVPTAQANREVLGVNDPGVEKLRIIVEVRAPAHDTGTPGESPGNLDGPFRIVYQLERNFPPLPTDPLDLGKPLELSLDFRDVNNISELETLIISDNDPLPIPRARAVRVGLTTVLTTRKEALAEEDLYVPNIEAKQLNAIFLQPGSDMAQLLAQQFDLVVNGLTFSAKPGRRTVFGASKALRHMLTGDHSAITFATQSELLQHWVVAILVDLNRDWTWDGLADAGFSVLRDGEIVGMLEIRQTLSASAVADGTIVDPKKRDVTHLVFFDAINPQLPIGKFPELLSPTWTITPNFKAPVSNAGAVKTLNVTLPVASLPHQTPKIVSAGIALAPYQHAPDYSSTETRRRVLWLELDEPALDPNDSYFARVLAYGPDPLLARRLIYGLEPGSGGSPPPNPAEPDLPVDPEPIRVITPNQPADKAGLDAMVELVPSPLSKNHFLLPLPPGITEDALELFGFWTYELRVGHARIWSTAQARFGRPLRVTGVQHPAPTLNCLVARISSENTPLAGQKSGIVVSAPYATPVLNGQNLINLSLNDPQTRMWVLLYAQVMQSDGQAHRNILLNHQPALPNRPDQRFVHVPTRDVFGQAFFAETEIQTILSELALPLNSSLSVLAVELLPGGTDAPEDPLGTNLGQERILRTSPLTPVPATC